MDVATGAILDSVSTTKTIFSYEIHPSYFRFVNYYDLLEIEGGYTHNEPAQLAVKEAIDAAVMHLTVQGINNLWRLKNPADWNSALIQRYLTAEQRSDNGDAAQDGRHGHPRPPRPRPNDRLKRQPGLLP